MIPQIPASTITEKIKNGEYSTKLSFPQYKKHVEGTKEFDDYLTSRLKKGNSPQGRLTISAEEAQEIIESYSGKGIIKVGRKGTVMNIEHITCDKEIGMYCQKGEWIKTNKASIYYGKKGAHLVPIKGNNYD